LREAVVELTNSREEAMNKSLPETNVIREYLLGRLDEQSELEAEISEHILSNDDLAELVESVEDEIIEEYLDGTLNIADRKSVEGYFLQPPERKEKLRFSRVLRGYFETKQSDSIDPVVGHWASLRPYYPAIALMLVIIVGLAYISRIRQKEAMLEAQLRQERAHSEELMQSALLPVPSQPAVTVFTLVLGQTRASGTPIPHIQIAPSTKRIIVEIVLKNPAAPGSPYDVRLESNAGTLIWSAQLLPIVSEGGARFVFDVPKEHLKLGMYTFTVSATHSPAANPEKCDFQVNVGD
jgi:hypothetical protein